MIKKNALYKSFGLEITGKDEEEKLPAIKEDFPTEIKESLRKNKKELNEIYQNAKNFLLSLMEETENFGRARDIEVLTGFMRETAEMLKRIRDIDKDLIDTEKGNNANDEKVNKINQFIFNGDTRDLQNFVESLHKNKKNKSISVKAEEIKEGE